MTLVEWEVLPAYERDAICAKTVMGWQYEDEDKLWWVPGDGKGMVRVGEFRPVSNRNDTALLLDEIYLLAKPARIAFDDALYTATPRGEEWEYELNILRSSPSLLSYCAVTACEKEKEEHAT